MAPTAGNSECYLRTCPISPEPAPGGREALSGSALAPGERPRPPPSSCPWSRVCPPAVGQQHYRLLSAIRGTQPNNTGGEQQRRRQKRRSAGHGRGEQRREAPAGGRRGRWVREAPGQNNSRGPGGEGRERVKIGGARADPALPPNAPARHPPPPLRGCPRAPPSTPTAPLRSAMVLRGTAPGAARTPAARGGGAAEAPRGTSPG